MCEKDETEVHSKTERKKKMAKSKFPSSYLKERRVRLGLQPCEVAKATGLTLETYRQIECRGQLPEEHFEKLAITLNVTVNELKAEKAAVIIEGMFGVPKMKIVEFIAANLRQ